MKKISQQLCLFITMILMIGTLSAYAHPQIDIPQAEPEMHIEKNPGGDNPDVVLIEPELIEEPEIYIPIEDYKEAAEYIAKTVYGEARGCSVTEQAAVIWCILNRVDERSSYGPYDVIRVVTKKNQFHGYIPSNPVTEEHYDLAIDVLSRWLKEKAGETDVGRVLPEEYLYFSGDGVHNHYRTDWRGGERWDWSLESPYVEVY